MVLRVEKMRRLANRSVHRSPELTDTHKKKKRECGHNCVFSHLFDLNNRDLKAAPPRGGWEGCPLIHVHGRKELNTTLRNKIILAALSQQVSF